MTRPLCITTRPEDLDQGLFGNVFYHPFQVLPYLYERGIFPAWQIRTMHYGDPPDRITIPGSVDLAYEAPKGPYREMPLNELRRRHGQVLGNDWEALSRIWNAYFRIPPRVLQQADEVMPKGRVLGVHYRGTDKQQNTWDSNPITQQQYLTLVREFLETRNDFDVIFAATDEFSFVERLRESSSLPVVALGEVEFHMAAVHTTTRAEKTDRAMVDCVLLSRCHCVLQTSSALPSFAKLFNPELETYRCAASRLFSNMPYFPVAFIPVLPVAQPASEEILRATMVSDWTSVPGMERYKEPFVARPRWPKNHRVFSLAGKMGMEEVAARVVKGFS